MFNDNGNERIGTKVFYLVKQFLISNTNSKKNRIVENVIVVFLCSHTYIEISMNSSAMKLPLTLILYLCGVSFYVNICNKFDLFLLCFLSV